jgi:hypothetical protein
MSQRSSAANSIVSWLWVGAPFMYGVYALVAKIPALFAN